MFFLLSLIHFLKFTCYFVTNNYLYTTPQATKLEITSF